MGGDTRLVLASASPRRRQLLSRLGVQFVVRAVEIAEDVRPGARPELEARRLAREKAEAARLRDKEAAVLAADTVVVLDGVVLGKPADEAEARRMLLQLRGRGHEVITAVALLPRGERRPLVRHALTRVWMREYTDDEIEASLARGDPFDKAGAYAIQDEVLRPVGSYEGCYCNVVGLPLWHVIEMLRKTGTAEPGTERLLPQCAACPLRGHEAGAGQAFPVAGR